MDKGEARASTIMLSLDTLYKLYDSWEASIPGRGPRELRESVSRNTGGHDSKFELGHG